MQTIFETVKDFVEKRKLEHMEAELAQQKAMSDYLAMMSGIEIPDEEVTTDVV